MLKLIKYLLNFILSRAEHIKDLGVSFVSHFSFYNQINNIHLRQYGLHADTEQSFSHP